MGTMARVRRVLGLDRADGDALEARRLAAESDAAVREARVALRSLAARIEDDLRQFRADLRQGEGFPLDMGDER